MKHQFVFRSAAVLTAILMIIPLSSTADIVSRQKTLSAFGSSTSLSSKHKQEIKSFVEANPGLQKLTCTGIRLESQTQYQNIQVRKRAKAACDYAQSLKPELAIWVQSKPTKAKSYSGKVLLTGKVDDSLDPPKPPAAAKTSLGTAFNACYPGINSLEFLATLSASQKTVELLAVDKFAIIDGGIQYKDLRCIGDRIGMPDIVHAKIRATNSLMGVVEATWTGYSAYWTYHPDSGLNITINQN